MLLLADPRISEYPVIENGCPLVDLRTHGVLVRTDAPDLPLDIDAAHEMALPHPLQTAPPVHMLVRESLAERLAAADAALPSGLRLMVVEGLRPLASQLAIHDGYRHQVRTARPDASEAEIDVLASRFVAPPATAPHVSGAAVDLTLMGADGPLDLGTPIDATPEESDGACYFDAVNISIEARHHRTVLAAALTSVGLVNYPTQWWHWSYGDRYWAHTTGHPHALHGPTLLG